MERGTSGQPFNVAQTEMKSAGVEKQDEGLGTILFRMHAKKMSQELWSVTQRT